jgi:hypothetical protein
MTEPIRGDVAERLTPPTSSAVLQPLQKRRHHHHASGPRWLRKLRKQIRRFPFRRLALVILGIVAVFIVVGVALASDAQTRVTTAMTSLERVLNSIRTKPGTELTLADFDRLQASVTDLSRTLANADRQTFFLRPLTRLSADAQVQLSLLDIGRDLVSAGQDMLTGLQPTLFFLVGGQREDTVVSQISSGERVVELLSLGRGRFLSAVDHLQRAESELAALDFNALTPEALLTLQQLQQTHTELVSISTLLLSAPDLLTTALGLGDEQTYLILAQNSDELRPSGGYLSSYGWMVMRNGRIVNYDYSATTTTSPNPPSNVEMPFEIPDWWLRFRQPIYAAWDGSWSPDFPTTAEMAMWYYNTGNNPHAPVTGVISIDITGFQTLLAALGDIKVPEFDVTVNSDNFRNVIYEIRAEDEGDLAHKQFLADLYRRIFEEWQSVDEVEVNSALLGALLQGLQEEHIMLYFSDPVLNESVERLGWSGSQGSGAETDYLMAVDANLGNKSNHSVIRQLTYDAEIDAAGTVTSRITVAYDYPASLADNDPAVDPEHHGPLDYRTLLQVITPARTESVQSTDDEQVFRVVNQPEHTLVTTLLTVPYDQAARIQYAYEIPQLVESFGPYQRYRLRIDKQPGTLNEAVSVQLALPPGASTVSIDPAPAASYDIDRPILEFRLETTRDQWIEVIYRLPSGDEA